jgi:Icc protein
MEIMWTEGGMDPLEFVTYWVPGRRKKAMDQERALEKHQLPIYHAKVEGLPKALDGLFICSDLQGHVKEGEEYILLGEWLPEFLETYLGVYFPDLKAEYIGIMLCGDMYARLEKRGGGGDVRPVWSAFNERFRWVAGVAGNHDYFGTKEEQASFAREEGIHLLEKQLIELDGLDIAGISGIIGREDKLFRVEQGEYLQALKRLLRKRPEFLLLHESPSCENEHGNPLIREILETASNTTTLFCGHCHWSKVQHQYPNGFEVFNLDARALFLHR